MFYEKLYISITKINDNFIHTCIFIASYCNNDELIMARGNRMHVLKIIMKWNKNGSMLIKIF